ncbi:MAG: sodium/proton-translocating pyrophosphatase [Fimbriimonadaceae bacterium]|nr:sodium/proton-translocating pyrophosphatase [Fimbriimonadaceae bacterium]
MFLQNMVNTVRSGSTRFLGALLTLALFLLPTLSFAGAEANIKLEFTQSDKVYLYISLGFGLIALLFGGYFAKKVMAQDPGNEAMREVSGAVKAGALAYLQQQIKTMLIFVLLLGVGLYFMYSNQFGAQVSLLTAISFLLGVGASYIAGYMGMIMAVNGNSRTAAAALKSYKTALEVAFQSGAVAGLVTVGIGLLGATAILLFFGESATKLLVGFGFGGSLAALFMRVGGGIYTKAADVGADLVGKVEAGIPEDDPRNPAVIADNVGDNVGDCAGMAADVFESYEVTLVAALVLGAATAAIFDQATWQKLILFALMARGVGIIASIVGIFMVKGSENLSDDPIKAIRKGFYGSAIFAVILTAGVAWFMMGGYQPESNKITTKQLVSLDQLRRDEIVKIQEIRNKIATTEKIERDAVTPDKLIESEEFKALGLSTMQAQQLARQALSLRPHQLPKPESLGSFRLLNPSATSGPAVDFVVIDQPFPPAGAPADAPPPKQVAIPLGEYLRKNKLITVEIEMQTPSMGPDNQPTTTTEKTPIGPITEDMLNQALERMPEADRPKVTQRMPVFAYASDEGRLLFATDPGTTGINLTRAQSLPLNIVKGKAADIQAKIDSNDLSGLTPITVETAAMKRNDVPWVKFLLCIVFGIVMAFIFELLTDYYVGLHNKPVQELGNLATTGPAPMIITGFAYGKESSVFSLFAIVACLVMPLLVFPAEAYGGFILSFYGIALVGLGLLTTTGFILAMDTFGPISDNAQGVFEMSGAAEGNEEGARRVQLLDAAGNTTKALTKGFAIATAVVAAVALFHAFVEEGKLTEVGMRLEVPQIFLGMLIGGAAPFLFAAFSINAVGRAAFELINEVRRQFREDAGIMAGTSKPDYGRCVAIVTAAAQRELLGPGILAVAFPALVAFGFAIGQPLTQIGDASYNLTGAQALGGFLAGTILSGQLLAVMLANSGGMWDNSKKLIEDGLHGGKGTEAHKAAVVCDTVGDPFKDTAGPAMNPLIKVMNLVSLLLAPIVILPLASSVQIGVTVAAAALLIFAIWWSKRGSMSSSLDIAGGNTPALATSGVAAPTETAQTDPAESTEEKK